MSIFKSVASFFKSIGNFFKKILTRPKQPLVQLPVVTPPPSPSLSTTAKLQQPLSISPVIAQQAQPIAEEAKPAPMVMPVKSTNELRDAERRKLEDDIYTILKGHLGDTHEDTIFWSLCMRRISSENALPTLGQVDRLEKMTSTCPAANEALKGLFNKYKGIIGDNGYLAYFANEVRQKIIAQELAVKRENDSTDERDARLASVGYVPNYGTFSTYCH